MSASIQAMSSPRGPRRWLLTANAAPDRSSIVRGPNPPRAGYRRGGGACADIDERLAGAQMRTNELERRRGRGLEPGQCLFRPRTIDLVPIRLFSCHCFRNLLGSKLNQTVRYET